MGILVDTSVWSLAFRRDAPPDLPEVRMLRTALAEGDEIVTTGMILLELLRGFVPAAAQETIVGAFASLTFVEPRRQDYVAAAAVGNTCRRAGVQIGSVDALIAQLAIDGDHVLLTTDNDFRLAARHTDVRVWSPPGADGMS
ncbi:PIN domain-containing protein [Galbitalea sp. SE-J8]|uniref:type II toxin-antitoxin system VapC family toxin n=1 Tax=Galbitalea sp. SE-J8 TaxID=3054952 RepID=UPI00259D1D49|nr:PIN domain-containing protein [Galbitalea sp. SE-J8]MDM4761521.1 PIN domain-containing protein [Galbitalea sp. SE-J8]